MAGNCKNLILIGAVQFLVVLSCSLELPFKNPIDMALDPLGSMKNITGIIKDPIKNIANPLEDVKNISNQLPDPFDVVGNISENLPDSLGVVKNISELVATTAVFTRNNVTLNCFGLPIKLFADAVKKMFMQETKAKDVRFYFASRSQPDYVTVLVDDDFSLRETDFDITRPTVVITHGFMSSGKESWLKEMKDAFLKLDDVNVIVVDWQKGSNTWNYFSAAISTRIVGLQIAKLFAQIREVEYASNSSPDVDSWGSLYFVGHSLGSHISAHAALLIRESQAKQENSWIVSRITGLDPAQPCFHTANLTLKLDKDDAPFVDVIHTNARQIYFLGLGLPDQLGFADFYPNGGEIQPGCSDIDTSIWSFLLLPKVAIQESICSHGRSHAFLTESVLNAASANCSFVGFQWNRSKKNIPKVSSGKCVNDFCTEMGINSSAFYPNNSGTFYVPTRASAPFCGKIQFFIYSLLSNTRKIE
ncbi:pancreatic triacylglycerol lipase [Nasonia vitripennis]|uniref:phospholipase A1 n=1 Tax=Nasonia vitripennis TaxID=7425 RepID=A0A7M7QDH8_NASVI|nr:pancreatic triacylglycerol lipase [Nasonia vitripennis]